MNLFNIKQEYINLVNTIIDNNGELSPELSQALAINETELKEKAINYGYVIRSFEYENDTELITSKMAVVGFEPTPPQRLVPKTSALDHSATLPHPDNERNHSCW